MANVQNVLALDLNASQSDFLGSINQALGNDYEIVDFQADDALSHRCKELPDSITKLLTSGDFKCVIISFDTSDGEESLEFLKLLEDFSYQLPVIAVGENEEYARPAISRGAHEFLTYDAICPCLAQVVENSIIRHNRWILRKFDSQFVRSQLQVDTDAWVVSDLKGCILFANRSAERIFGQSSAELKGQNVGVPTEEGVMEIEVMRQTQHGPQAAILEMRVLDINWKGQKAFLQLIRDVTDHKKQIRESRDAIRQRDQFLATLSHELRNPLTALSSAAWLLNERDSRSEQEAELITMMMDQCASMKHLLDELMDLSRISRSKIDLLLHHYDIDEIFAQSLAVMRPLADAREQTIVLEPFEQGMQCYCDFERLKQVINNLLSNAIKYSPRETEIHIKVLTSDTDLTIAIQDQGRGIAKHMLESVFEPFVQLRHADNARGEGLGIGLALCRKLVEMHEGKTWAESHGEGQGSTFYVQLPRQPEGDEQAVKTGDQSDQLNVDQMSVVLIEDRAEVRMTVTLFLESMGFNVTAAANGYEGVSKIMKLQPDLAIIDIGLPDISGYEVAQTLRSQMDETPLLIALSGHGEKRDKQLAKQAGFHHHITKPLTAGRLKEVLNSRSVARS